MKHFKLYLLLLCSAPNIIAMWQDDARAIEFVEAMEDVFSFSKEAQKQFKKQTKTSWGMVSFAYELCSENSLLFLKKMIKKDAEFIKSGEKPQVITSNLYCTLLFTWLIKPLSQDKKNELLDYAFDQLSYFTMLQFLIALGAKITP